MSQKMPSTLTPLTLSGEGYLTRKVRISGSLAALSFLHEVRVHLHSAKAKTKSLQNETNISPINVQTNLTSQ